MNKIIIEKEILKNAQFFLKTKDTFKTKALTYFEQHGLPEKIAPLISPRFVQKLEPDVQLSGPQVVDPRGVILLVNGVYDSSKSILPTGVSVNSHPNFTTEHFNDSYDALNAVATISPMEITISKNMAFNFPISIYHTVTESGVNKIISPRLSIVLEENSEANFIEIHTSENVDMFQYTTNAFTSFSLKKNAKAEHVKLSMEAKKSIHLGWTIANLAKDSSFLSTVIDLGQLASAHHLQINLNEAGAETVANSLFSLEKTEKNNIFTTINHKHSHTHSKQLCKGVLRDESFGVFNGNIVVFPDAQEITSSQLNKNLLLSKKAHIDTRPQLLVSADDVKCSHGATVGQLSDEEAFYLESRGIKKERAKEMLMHGFSREIILLIKNQQIRSYCESKIL